MWKQPPPAQKMGQKVSHEDSQEKAAETLVICEVFSQGVVHASQRLKDYLGFVDPQSKFQLATNTLSEIFLVNFICFCVEKGAEECIMTSKMTKQQSSLFGVDWIWTLSGADKQIKLQLAVQALQLAELVRGEGGPAEATSASETSRFEKLAEFCRLVGRDCLGLFIVFGVPGKPKDIRGVMLDSIAKEEQKCRLSGKNALRQFVTNTDSFLPAKDMLANCLGTKNGPKEVGNVYVKFL
ncbi:rab15 effector protein [Athene noctua]|uniref:rab15 effector protein n=1 Tax=Athene noctua TaxID=126797 RepID=UPI003EBDA099